MSPPSPTILLSLPVPLKERQIALGGGNDNISIPWHIIVGART